MKNLKKVLSLVLALAMALSLMTVAFAADASDYADSDKITNTEAVSVLSALDVINGKDGNKFDPTGTVTRAEMAKMITVIALGDVDVSAFKGTTTDLKDANGWAEAYIKYCYSQGVISGRGNGIFDPNANVTTAEAAKMLLVAIGYNAKVQGYEGLGWAINVTRDAQLSGFFANLSVTSDKALSRDEAAQMIYNAVKANTITKTSSVDRVTGNITDSYHANGAPLLNKTFGAYEGVAVLDTVTYSSSNKKYTYTPDATFDTRFERKDDNTLGEVSFSTTEDFTALEGEEVSVIYKKASNGDISVLGISATGKSTVVTSTVSALEADDAKLKVNGTSYELENDLAGQAGTLAALDASYDTVKLVDSDGNGKLDVAVTTVITPAKVTFVSSTEIIAGGTTYKYADNEIADGLAKKDYVTIVTKTNGVKVIEKLAPVTGTIDGEKTSVSGTNYARLDGTWYAKNGETLTVKNTYTFYAVNGVVVANSVDASSADIANLIMVLATSNVLLNNQAVVMDATGAQKTVTIDTAGDTATAGSLYTYTETTKGYKLANAANIGSDYTWVAGSTADIATASSKLNKIGGSDISDTAVIFVQTTDGGKVISGKQFKNLASSLLDTSATKAGVASNKIWDNDLGSYTSTVNGLTRVSYAGIFFNGKAKDLGVNNGNTNYAYVTSDYYTVADATTYTIWTGSENLTVIDADSHTLSKGDVITYDAIDGDKISGVSAVTISGTLNKAGTDGIAYVQGIEGKYVFLNGGAIGTNDYEITSDTKYIYIDSNATTADAIGMADGELVLATQNVSGVYTDNVIAVVDGSAKVELLVIDVKNNLTNAVNATLGVTMGGLTGTYAQASASTTANLKVGDIITITVKNTGGDVAAKTITLTGAKYMNGTSGGSATISVPALTAGNSLTYSVVVTGAVSFSVA